MSELIKRQSARQMDQQDLQNYRAAMRQIQALPVADERSFAHIAGIHGFPPPSYCHTDSTLFLPWHRAYILYLEKSINEMLERMYENGSNEITPDIDGNGREVAPKVGIPWWDWTSSVSNQQGIPKAFSNHMALDGQPNPLWKAELQLAQYRNEFDQLEDQQRIVLYRDDKGVMVNTRAMDDGRIPNPPLWRLPSPEMVEGLLEADDYLDFQTRLERGMHGALHVWVGGTMSRVPTAGWDPIFYSHHCMVDRIWYLWQLKHNSLDRIPGLPESYYRTALPPFKMTVEETLNPVNLGYEYASSSTTIELKL